MDSDEDILKIKRLLRIEDPDDIFYQTLITCQDLVKTEPWPYKQIEAQSETMVSRLIARGVHEETVEAYQETLIYRINPHDQEHSYDGWRAFLTHFFGAHHPRHWISKT